MAPISKPTETVLVTGGSGFIATWVLISVLNAGYQARTTVRSLSRSSAVTAALQAGGISADVAASVQFFAADLTSDDGWAAACEGCTYVLHVASPFPASAPKDEDELIVPAREGTLRALKFAKAAGVKRVVVTSSCAAVVYGHAISQQRVFTEADWTKLEGSESYVSAYTKSKTVAERAAWDWHRTSGEGLELATINPVLVLGPVLAKNASTSLELVVRLLNGMLPGLPDLSFGIVDVRDVADLHVLAMKSANAAGQRYLAVSDEQDVHMRDMAAYLKEGLPKERAKKVPSRSLPTWLLKIAGFFDQGAALIVPELGAVRKISNTKAKTELGWTPRNAKEATLASAESLHEFGVVA